VKETRPARQGQRQQTRARLVEAALRVFAEQGYDHATVEEISIAAGYSKGAYYFHFDSKEEILLELLSDWVEDQTQRLLSFKTAGGKTTVSLLTAIESILRYDDRNPYWRLLLPEIWAQSHRNEKVLRTLEDAYARWIGTLEDAFENAQREGLVSLTVRPAVAASILLAAHDGLVLHSRLGPAAEGGATSSQLLAALLSSAEAASVVPPAVRRTVRRKKSPGR
jgi:AcrR family transcriptional regulator